MDLSTPSLGITDRGVERVALRCRAFNSLSRDHADQERHALELVLNLSTPSLGITFPLREVVSEPTVTSVSFNSLSRDHLLGRVEEFTRFTFQLPLSGSHIQEILNIDPRPVVAFQLPLSGSPHPLVQKGLASI